MKVDKKEGISRVTVKHNKVLFWIIIFLILVLIIVLYNILRLQNEAKIANPASVFCTENKGKLIIVNDINGSYGLCEFSDGSQCEEWAYFNGECNKSINFADDFCLFDEDCVPASCCHPTSCVNKNNAPKCEGLACTMSCEPNTLDCNQAICKCLNKKCKIVFNK